MGKHFGFSMDILTSGLSEASCVFANQYVPKCYVFAAYGQSTMACPVTSVSHGNGYVSGNTLTYSSVYGGAGIANGSFVGGENFPSTNAYVMVVNAAAGGGNGNYTINASLTVANSSNVVPIAFAVYPDGANALTAFTTSNITNTAYMVSSPAGGHRLNFEVQDSVYINDQSQCSPTGKWGFSL